jgi:hypothetical protein
MLKERRDHLKRQPFWKGSSVTWKNEIDEVEAEIKDTEKKIWDNLGEG